MYYTLKAYCTKPSIHLVLSIQKQSFLYSKITRSSESEISSSKVNQETLSIPNCF